MSQVRRSAVETHPCPHLYCPRVTPLPLWAPPRPSQLTLAEAGYAGPLCTLGRYPSAEGAARRPTAPQPAGGLGLGNPATPHQTGTPASVCRLPVTLVALLLFPLVSVGDRGPRRAGVDDGCNTAAGAPPFHSRSPASPAPPRHRHRRCHRRPYRFRYDQHPQTSVCCSSPPTP